VKIIWQALFDLAQPRQQNAWLLANSESKKTTQANSIMTGPFDVQEVLNEYGFTDFSTQIHMNPCQLSITITDTRLSTVA
jgi:hypothetical protein